MQINYGNRFASKVAVKSQVIYCVLIAALILQGCASPDQKSHNPKYNRLAAKYASRDSVGEAKKDFEQGSYEIYSAMAYSLYYPGLDYDVGDAVAKKFGVMHLSGTTDAIKSDAHREFVLAAFHFGMQYNQMKMKLLKDSGKL